MFAGKFNQHPDERKKYTLEYEDWLDTGETISSYVISVSPETDNTLVVDGDSVEDDTKISFFASVGDDASTYIVEVQATTSGGQVKVDQVQFTVRD